MASTTSGASGGLRWGTGDEGVPQGVYARLKYRTWQIFDKPDSSRYAAALSTMIVVCIILSATCFIVQTLPQFGTESRYEPFWWNAEVFFVSVFTVEFLCRLWATPEPLCHFMTKGWNLVDFLSIMPFYAELVIQVFFISQGHNIDIRALRTMRLIRVFRVFRLLRYSSNMRLIMRAVSKSWEALMLLLFFLVVCLFLFGALMYYSEQGLWNEAAGCYVRETETACSPFQSIPATFYWGITTMTTVGYGDVLPITPQGKMVTGVTMLVGILIIAMPVTLMGNNFATVYEEIHQEEVAHQLHKEAPTFEAMHLKLTEDLERFNTLSAQLKALAPKLQSAVQASMEADGCSEERLDRTDYALRDTLGNCEQKFDNMEIYFQHLVDTMLRR